MSFVELQQVSRAYGNGEKTFYALDHIDLTMEKGEFVVVLGPSGAGKSTLLNLLGGMDSPTGGSIRIGDQDIAAMSGKQLTKFRASNVGFVFQFYNKRRHHSGCDGNGLRCHGYSGQCRS